MNSHISQFPTATYKKGHRHGPGAHVIILSGEGYSLMWPEGEEPRRYEWHAGSMIVPPNMWYHQHFNTGTEPARYLAFKHEVVSIRNAQGVPKAWISQRVGGDQIDYADESSYVRETFRDALAKHGMEPKMDDRLRAGARVAPAEAGRGRLGLRCRTATRTARARARRSGRRRGRRPLRLRARPRPRARRRRGPAARGQPDLAAGQRHAAQRRHGHRLLGHAGRLLPAAPAPHRRGADQPLRRRPAGHDLPLAGGADPVREQRAHRRRGTRLDHRPRLRRGRRRPGGRSTPASSS